LDLRLVRNQWLLIDPKIEFLMSEANEEKTHGDFREMGQRLAQEVVSFLKRKKDRYARQGHLKSIKLSFVGHSIGNVIIRTAIADSLMEPYRKYLHTYLSLSGPHLGYLYSTNSLFNSGLWLLKKLKSTQVIHQLTLTDDPDLRHTFFYKLCKVREKYLNLYSVSPRIRRTIRLLFGSKIGLNSFSAKDIGEFQKYNSPLIASGRLCSISLSKNRVMPTCFFRQLEKGSCLLGNAE
jgi:hypothetical protein